jgi:hypothetical protein
VSSIPLDAESLRIVVVVSQDRIVAIMPRLMVSLGGTMEGASSAWIHRKLDLQLLD